MIYEVMPIFDGFEPTRDDVALTTQDYEEAVAKATDLQRRFGYDVLIRRTGNVFDACA